MAFAPKKLDRRKMVPLPILHAAVAADDDNEGYDTTVYLLLKVSRHHRLHLCLSAKFKSC